MNLFKFRYTSLTQHKNYIIVIAIAATIVAGLWGYNFNKHEKKLCKFEISDLKEYKGQYSKDSEFIVYEGLIRNKLQSKETLLSMVAKIYSDSDVLLADGGTTIREDLAPGKALPFKIQVNFDLKQDAIKKYYTESKYLKPDIYPWFITCK